MAECGSSDGDGDREADGKKGDGDEEKDGEADGKKGDGDEEKDGEADGRKGGGGGEEDGEAMVERVVVVMVKKMVERERGMDKVGNSDKHRERRGKVMLNGN